MRVPFPAGVGLLAALSFGFLATMPPWSSAQSRVDRIPAVGDHQIDPQVQRVTAEADATLATKRIERLPIIDRLPPPIGKVSAPRRMAMPPAKPKVEDAKPKVEDAPLKSSARHDTDPKLDSVAELDSDPDPDSDSDSESGPVADPMPHDTSDFEPVFTLAPPQTESILAQRTSEDSSAETNEASSSTDRLAAARRRNRIAEPLSGEFDFEQPMEALSNEMGDVPRPVGTHAAIKLPRGVETRAQQLLREATVLADRGAIYAANREFLRVMRMITQSLDSQIGEQRHTHALAAGLRALEEAEDFSLANGDRVEDDVHLARYVSAHRTPVLKHAELEQMTPLRAIQRYYEYARAQLTIAAGGTRLGSQALYALGRAETFLGKERPIAVPGAPKSIAFFHAALSADAYNVRAGNELAVMLARRGRLREAAQLLQNGVQVAPLPTAINNLAKIFEQLGDPRSAMMRRQAQQLAAASPNAARSDSGARVTWVDPDTFAAADHLPTAQLEESSEPTIGQATWTAPSHPYQHAIARIRTTQKDPAANVPMPKVRNLQPLGKQETRGPWW